MLNHIPPQIIGDVAGAWGKFLLSIVGINNGKEGRV